MTSYAVVVFTGEEGIAMIPEVWCVGDNRCYWPPFKTVQRFERALLSCEPPKENWALYDMRILRKTDSYDKARQLVTKAQDTSDLQTDAEEDQPNRKRQKKANPRYFPEESSESEGENILDQTPEVTSVVNTPPRFEVPSRSASVGLPHARRDPQLPVPPPLPELRTVSPIAGRAVDITSPVTPSTTTANVTATQRLMLKLLVELQTELKELKADVRQLRVASVPPVQAVADEEEYQLPDGVVMPCSTLEELKLLDAKLKVDSSLRKHMLTLMMATGGSDLRDVVKRTMKTVFTNAVEVQLNWTGQGTKASFEALALKPIFEKAIRRTRATSGCDLSEIKREIIHYLKGSTDRQGGRNARRNPPPAQAQADN